MCIKTINVDTYGDGAQKVYETVELCRPGASHMCAHPKVKEVRRVLAHKSRGSNGSDGIDFLRVVPSPRHSKSPSPTRSGGSGSDSDARRRRHRSGIYVNGEKVVELHRRRSPHRESTSSPVPELPRRGRDRRVDVVQPRFAPSPPSPRLKRSSTLPSAQDLLIANERRHQHLLATANTSAVRRSPLPAFSRRASAALQDASTPATPLILVDDEREREERRRRRAERRASTFVTTAAPAVRNTATLATPSPAAAAVRKELRWEDEERQRQNERISSRQPKPPKEVRSILKHAAPAATPAVQPSRFDVEAEQARLAALRRAMSGLAVDDSALRRTRHEDPSAMKERLAARFIRSPTGGPRVVDLAPGADRRRTSAYYPGEGLYRTF